jgi:hypothetical protein
MNYYYLRESLIKNNNKRKPFVDRVEQKWESKAGIEKPETLNEESEIEIVKEERKRIRVLERKMQTNFEAIISIVIEIKIGIVVKHLKCSSHHFLCCEWVLILMEFNINMWHVRQTGLRGNYWKYTYDCIMITESLSNPSFWFLRNVTHWQN